MHKYIHIGTDILKKAHKYTYIYTHIKKQRVRLRYKTTQTNTVIYTKSKITHTPKHSVVYIHTQKNTK